LLLVAVLSVAAQAPQLVEKGKPIEAELKGGDTQHTYSIPLEVGEYLDATVDQRGIDVIVRVFAPDGTRIAEVDSPNGSNGPEPIAFAVKKSGFYRVEVAALDKEAPLGKYEIQINKILTTAEYTERLAKERAVSDAVVKWFASNAVPLKTVEAGNGFADMQPLKRILRDARFVGLGEATHGTREFFQFKHRMVEFPVKETGYRVFAMEASYAGCRNINDYINGVQSDGAKALASQGFWTWNTEEVRAMIDWMRTYNASVPPDQKIKFIGFDVQVNSEAYAFASEYLKKVAPDRAAELASLPPPAAAGSSDADRKSSLEGLTFDATTGSPSERPAAAAKLKDVRAKYNELLGDIVLREPVFTQKTPAADYERAVHSLRVIAQYIDAYATGDFSLRDQYMADNLKRLASAEPAGTKFVVWAHNGHIGMSEEDDGGLGTRLRKYFGKEYYAVGFSFDHGGFQAREMDLKVSPKRLLTGYTLPPAPEGSADWHLARTGIGIFFVNLRSPVKDAVVNTWLDGAHGMRSIGSVFSAASDPNSVAPTNLRKSFDGIFFVNTTTRARPNAGVRDVAPVQ
jgi:erythromycin esterase